MDTKNNAENLCYTAEKLVSDSGDKMQDSDKNEINTKVAALRETLKNGTVDQIKSGMDDLQKAVYAASEKLYQQQAPQGGQPGSSLPIRAAIPATTAAITAATAMCTTPTTRKWTDLWEIPKRNRARMRGRGTVLASLGVSEKSLV